MTKPIELKLSKEVAQTIRVAIDEEVARWIRANLTTTIKSSLQKVVYSLLGLNCDRWGEITLKKDNELFGLLDDKVKERVQRCVGLVTNNFMGKVERDKMFVNKLTAAMMESFNDRLYSSCREYGSNLADAIIASIKGQVDAAINQVAAKPLFNTELENPSSFEGKVGKLVLEQFAERLAKSINEDDEDGDD